MTIGAANVKNHKLLTSFTITSRHINEQVKTEDLNTSRKPI
jgi:hypothetical protein